MKKVVSSAVVLLFFLYYSNGLHAQVTDNLFVKYKPFSLPFSLKISSSGIKISGELALSIPGFGKVSLGTEKDMTTSERAIQITIVDKNRNMNKKYHINGTGYAAAEINHGIGNTGIYYDNYNIVIDVTDSNYAEISFKAIGIEDAIKANLNEAYLVTGNAKTEGERLNMRKDPNINSDILDKIPNGTHFPDLKTEVKQGTVGNETGFWWKVSYKKKTGWVWSKYLDIDYIWSSCVR